MADLHPKVEALFKTSPTCSHGNYCEADVRRIALRAVELEREECAKVCENSGPVNLGLPTQADYAREDCADAIRRRGEP